MKTIKLFIKNGEWVADFVNDGEMFERFKTTLIPTAYTHRASVQDVLTKVKALNPGYHVIAIAYHDYHQWAVFGGEHNAVIASFNTQTEALNYENNC